MILVTGGAGFIGSILIKELNKEGLHHIIVTDRLEKSEKWKNLLGLKFHEYIHADELFQRGEHFWQDIELIFHMGACSTTTELNMDFLMKNNVEYSKHLFSIAARLSIPFIYASSAATYGDGKQGHCDNHELSVHLKPLNRYGYSKQLFDVWALKQKEVPIPWFGMKFFNVYGPQEYHKAGMRSVVHQAFEQIRDHSRVKLFKSYKTDIADGEQLRDFVYVKDVCKAMIELSRIKEKQASGLYNMGTGQARSFNDLVVSCFEAMNKQIQIDYIDMPLELRNQYQYYTQADMRKFLNLMPHFKFSSLETGVKDYIQNYLMTENAYC